MLVNFKIGFFEEFKNYVNVDFIKYYVNYYWHDSHFIQNITKHLKKNYLNFNT